MESRKKVITKYHSNILNPTYSTQIYNYLKDNIQWEEGVRSRITGFTRLAKALNYGDNTVIDNAIIEVFNKLNLMNQYQIQGLYLNFYKNGTHHTPSHSHKNQIQLIISLGATRTLRVGTKNYSLNNGDVIIFGSSTHSVPIEPSILNGRISIATFMQPLCNHYQC